MRDVYKRQEPFNPTLKRGDFPKVQYTSYSRIEHVLPWSNTYPSTSIWIDDFKSSLYSKPSFEGREAGRGRALLTSSVPPDYIQTRADRSFRTVTLKRPRTSFFSSYLYCCLCVCVCVCAIWFHGIILYEMMYTANCPCHRCTHSLSLIHI